VQYHPINHSLLTHQHPRWHFTLWPKVERPLITINQIARNQKFGLSTLHTMVKVQRLSQFKMITFWRRRQTLEGSLGRTGMKNPNYGREAVGFFSLKKSITDKIFAIRLEELFWARNKVGCSFGFGLWAWPLEASHYGRPSREAVGVHGQRFGLWAWPFEGFTLWATSHTRLRACDHYTSSTLIGGKGRAGPSLLHTMLEGPTEYANARRM
jgi:hypothetical protein